MQTPQKEGKMALFKPLCLRTLLTAVREKDVLRKGFCCHSHPHTSPLRCVGGTSRPLHFWGQIILALDPALLPPSWRLWLLVISGLHFPFVQTVCFPRAVCEDETVYGISPQHPAPTRLTRGRRGHTPCGRVPLKPSTLALEHETAPKPYRQCCAHHPHFTGEQTEAQRG